MYFLIDYENVGSAGLAGAEYLCGEDQLILFYSQARCTIQSQYMRLVTERAGGFRLIKLKTKGKNNLDMYIAVHIGELIAEHPEARLAVISRDRGYEAVRDYAECYGRQAHPIVLGATVEDGIARGDADSSRGRQIAKLRCPVPIEPDGGRGQSDAAE